MSGHRTWRDIRRERERDPAYRAAYARVRQAITIGMKVRHLREAIGISQAELARRMGSTQSVIARLELGGAEPRFETLARVAEALDSALVIDLQPIARTATGEGHGGADRPPVYVARTAG